MTIKQKDATSIASTCSGSGYSTSKPLRGAHNNQESVNVLGSHKQLEEARRYVKIFNLRTI